MCLIAPPCPYRRKSTPNDKEAFEKKYGKNLWPGTLKAIKEAWDNLVDEQMESTVEFETDRFPIGTPLSGPYPSLDSEQLKNRYHKVKKAFQEYNAAIDPDKNSGRAADERPTVPPGIQPFMPL